MSKKRERVYRRRGGSEGGCCDRMARSGKGNCCSLRSKNQSEVKKKSLFRERAKEETPLPLQESPLLKEAVSLWQKANIHRYKGATALKYENLINNHILPVLGECPLSALNTGLLADFMNNKLRHGRVDHTGGLSPSYVRSIMLVILEIMDFAAEENMCAALKTKIRKPAAETHKPEILDVHMQTHLEKQLLLCPDETGVGILLSLNTGLRIGEICALRWTDIDLKNAVLHIRSTVARVKNTEGENATKLIIDKPKTSSSVRDIPIPERLMSVLLPLYAKRRSEYVISDREGFVSPRTYEYRFHRVLKENHIKPVNYHALRHTFATRCIEHGVDVKTLSEILGHANVAITLNTYVHSSMERKREQLEKLAKASA